ncbi:MAG: hypothetical protein WCT02_00060 [Candidatus Paceibacterota bacterium]
MSKNKKIFVSFLLAVVGICGWAFASPFESFAAGLFNIDENGNVGIGNINPQSKLDVTGAIYSRLVTATSSTILWSAGNVQSLTLSNSPTLVFGGGQAGGEYTLILGQDSTGGRTVTWPSDVKWPNGVTPTLTSTANSIDTAHFLYDGSYYLGTYGLNYKVPVSAISFSSSGADSSGSFSFNNASGNFMIVAIIKSSSGNSTCTYNGTSLNHLSTAQWGNGGSNWLEIQTLANPSTGSHTLSCSGGGYISEQVVTYSNVGTSQPDWYRLISQPAVSDPFTFSQTTGSGGTGSVTGTNDWSVYITCTAVGQNGFSSSNWTQREGDFSGCQVGDSNGIINTTSYTQSNTWTGFGASSGISAQITIAP